MASARQSLPGITLKSLLENPELQISPLTNEGKLTCLVLLHFLVKCKKIFFAVFDEGFCTSDICTHPGSSSCWCFSTLKSIVQNSASYANVLRSCENIEIDLHLFPIWPAQHQMSRSRATWGQQKGQGHSSLASFRSVAPFHPIHLYIYVLMARTTKWCMHKYYDFPSSGQWPGFTNINNCQLKYKSPLLSPVQINMSRILKQAPALLIWLFIVFTLCIYTFFYFKWHCSTSTLNRIKLDLHFKVSFNRFTNLCIKGYS